MLRTILLSSLVLIQSCRTTFLLPRDPPILEVSEDPIYEELIQEPPIIVYAGFDYVPEEEPDEPSLDVTPEEVTSEHVQQEPLQVKLYGQEDSLRIVAKELSGKTEDPRLLALTLASLIFIALCVIFRKKI